MEKIRTATGLREAILQLEAKQADEELMLKEQFQETVESVKPINLIKNVFKQAVGLEEVKDNLFNTSIGLTAGLASKLLFQFLTKSPVKKLVGTALMFGITNIVAKNPEKVRSLGLKFLNIFRSKSAKKVYEADPNKIK
jgi:hypothetical protein